MTVRALAFEYAHLGRDPSTGALLLQVRAVAYDDADNRSQVPVALTVAVPAGNPASWQNDIRQAVVDACAALSPPMSLAPGQVSLLAF